MEGITVQECFTPPPEVRDCAAVTDEYVRIFNQHDEELHVTDISNSAVASWMKREVPFFECADPLLERVWWFRWWVFRKHITSTPEGRIITEFLPKVYWSGAYNSINCANGHHIAEARWLRGGKDLIREYVLFWLKGSGDEFSYSSWLPDALMHYAMVRNDKAFAVEHLDELVRFYREVERRNLTQYGLFWSDDDRDAMEDSISGPGLRPTLNSYMAANAHAIATIAQWAGKPALAAEYECKRQALVHLMHERLWDDQEQFFKVVPLESKDGEVPSWDFSAMDPAHNVREEIGYIPWAFGLADAKQGQAWKYLGDSRHFAGAAGIRTADASHPRYMEHASAHECQWNGPCWPFATTQTLNSMIAAIRGPHAELAPDDFMRELRRYASIHCRFTEDGRIVDWLDEDLDADTGEWISREQLKAWDWPEDRGGYERGKDYNHSTFADIVISGFAGIHVEELKQGPAGAPAPTLTVAPLATGHAMPYWRLLGVPVGDETIDVYYDMQGDRYGYGAGLTVLVSDGRRLQGEQEVHAPLTRH